MLLEDVKYSDKYDVHSNKHYFFKFGAYYWSWQL